MKSIRTFLLPLVILSTLDEMVLSATMSGDHYRVTRRIHLHHAVNESLQFSCKQPQLRAYNFRDLWQKAFQNNSENPTRPIYVVLKRCDKHSGCCMSPDMSCTPVKSKIYQEELEVEIISLLTGTRRQWIKVEQHGECTCEANEEVSLLNELPKLETL